MRATAGGVSRRGPGIPGRCGAALGARMRRVGSPAHCGLAAAGLLGLGLAAALPHPAWAAETNLGSIGRTRLQQDTGDAVQRTCAGFVASDTQPGTVPLFDTCRAMVQTGNEVNNTGGPTRDSLGLTGGQLSASLQQIATEEFAATESMATEISSTRLNTVLTRLIEVRRGVRGFSVAGLSPDDRPSAVAGAYAPGVGERGGAAGENDTWGRLGVFLNASYGMGNRDETLRSDEFDFDTYEVVGGADYRVTDHVVLGGAVSYFNVDADFKNKPTVNGGSVDADGWGGFLYGTYYGDRFYVDGMAGYAKSDYDVKRKILIPSNNPSIPTINETAKASPDSDDYTLSAGAGYTLGQGALSYGPYARLTYLKVDVDDYRERGAEASGLNLDVRGQDWTSFTSVLGGRVAYAISRGFGVLSPQAQIGWVHEFKNASKTIGATYVDDPLGNVLLARTDKPDRDYFEVGLGVAAVFQGGVQVFFNYDTVLGFSDLTDHIFTIGGRLEFL